MIRRRVSDHHGIALLLVLLLLVILATTTATIAFATSSQSLAVFARTQQTQHKFAVDAALDVIHDQYVNGQIRSKLIKQGHLAGTIDLGQIRVKYRIWDEATKIRLQSIDKSDTKLKLPAGISEVTPRHVGVSGDHQPMLFEDAFVVGMDQLGEFYGSVDASPPQETAMIDLVTLWGDGRLNLYTASDDAIRMRFADADTVVADSIIAARRYGRQHDLNKLIATLGLNERQTKVVAMRLTAGPTAIAIRLSVRDDMRRSESFAVMKIVSGRPRLLLYRDLPPTRHGRLIGMEEGAQ